MASELTEMEEILKIEKTESGECKEKVGGRLSVLRKEFYDALKELHLLKNSDSISWTSMSKGNKAVLVSYEEYFNVPSPEAWIAAQENTNPDFEHQGRALYDKNGKMICSADENYSSKSIRALVMAFVVMKERINFPDKNSYSKFINYLEERKLPTILGKTDVYIGDGKFVRRDSMDEILAETEKKCDFSTILIRHRPKWMWERYMIKKLHHVSTSYVGDKEYSLEAKRIDTETCAKKIHTVTRYSENCNAERDMRYGLLQ